LKITTNTSGNVFKLNLSKFIFYIIILHVSVYAKSIFRYVRTKFVNKDGLSLDHNMYYTCNDCIEFN